MNWKALLAFWCLPASGLTLEEAVRAALSHHPSIAASAANIHGAQARVRQAKAGVYPQVVYQQSFVRSDNPVFVFGSLLTQHQFSEKNFAVNSLNKPDFLNNSQSLLTVDQSLYDGGQRRARQSIAGTAQGLSEEQLRLTRLNVMAGVAKSYFAAQLAAQSGEAAASAVRSAEADLERARNIRAAGMSTDADVLSVAVHLAGVKEQQIRRAAEKQVSLATLNEAMGTNLDDVVELTTPLSALPMLSESTASSSRPEQRQAALGVDLAHARIQSIKATFKPQVGLRGVLESDRQRVFTRGGMNWMGAATLRWTLFDGYARKNELDESMEAAKAAEAAKNQVDNAVNLEVRKARTMLASASQRVNVAAASVTQAEESLRITKNRYENGLATLSDLLRNETAVLESRNRHLSAIHDTRAAAVDVELAKGTLTEASDVLK